MALEEQPDENRCRPCRGTGKIISSKGGQAHDITCPWCGGSGVQPPPQAPDDASPE